MCRSARVLCVAADEVGLVALKRASVTAEWELCPGATDAAAAMAQIEAERPHAIVAFGPFEDLLRQVGQRFPGMRIVSDRVAPGAVVATSLEDVRGLLTELPRPGGPVRT